MAEQKPELRQCTRCHSNILLQYFELNRKGELFKLCNNCRTTRRNQKAIYRENNRDKILLEQAEYRYYNKEKIAEASKIYRENNKDKIKEQKQKYKKTQQTQNTTS